MNILSFKIRSTFNKYRKFLQIFRRKLSSTIQEKHYDFVVIGSGAAGSVIASRLSENPRWNILLLEAGKCESKFLKLPVASAVAQKSTYDWNFLAEPQLNFARGMNDGIVRWPRGKGLGGSTAINYMIYTRGNKRDYDEWAKQGNPGWAYEDVLPYFLKSENATNLNCTTKDCTFHNNSGPWHVEDCHVSELTNAFLESGREMGLPSPIDYNAKDQIGFGPIQGNLCAGCRHSVANAFLRPVEYRENLDIQTCALVKQILIGENLKTWGVEYEHKNKIYRAKANKEVILSAGVLSSPHLLMLSGIGPSDQLNRYQIPVLKDLPVGQNLLDHVMFLGLIFLVQNSTHTTTLQTLLHPKSMSDYIFYRKGPLTTLGGISGIGFIKSSIDSHPDPNFPDIEFLFTDANLATDRGIVAKSVNISSDLYNNYWKPLEKQEAFQIFPLLMHPKSVGRIQLNSNDITVPPKFYGNYFSDPFNIDQQTMLAGIRYAIKLSEAASFQKYGVKLYETPIPGCEKYKFNSDDYWLCALETLSSTIHHQVGTCKMGPSTDEFAVVDSQLKVHGVEGLRVVDSSVIPVAITGHTSAPTVMIGEKAADMIKASWIGDH